MKRKLSLSNIWSKNEVLFILNNFKVKKIIYHHKNADQTWRELFTTIAKYDGTIDISSTYIEDDVTGIEEHIINSIVSFIEYGILGYGCVTIYVIKYIIQYLKQNNELRLKFQVMKNTVISILDEFNNGEILCDNRYNTLLIDFIELCNEHNIWCTDLIIDKDKIPTTLYISLLFSECRHRLLYIDYQQLLHDNQLDYTICTIIKKTINNDKKIICYYTNTYIQLFFTEEVLQAPDIYSVQTHPMYDITLDELKITKINNTNYDVKIVADIDDTVELIYICPILNQTYNSNHNTKTILHFNYKLSTHLNDVYNITILIQ